MAIITLIVAVDFVRPEFELEENMFDVGVLIDEPSQALITGKLSLFKRFSIPSSTCADWWWMHEGQMFNVAFLTNCFLRIPVSQTETKQVFSLVRVLTTLRCYGLQVESMD